MAPLNFEEHVKEQLQKRTIQPSNEGWDKLNAKLNEVEKPNNGKWITVTIAASVIVLFGLVFFWINDNNVEGQIHNQVVVSVENNTIEAKDEVKNVVPKKKMEESVVVSLSAEKEPKIKADVRSRDKVQITEKKKVFDRANENNLVEKSDVAINIDQNGLREIKQPKLKKSIADRTAALLAEVHEKEQLNIEVSEAEIDELLRKAQWEITQQQLNYKKEINAMALLDEVENELDENFKERVYEALKESFYKLKTTVVQREN